MALSAEAHHSEAWIRAEAKRLAALDSMLTEHASFVSPTLDEQTEADIDRLVSHVCNVSRAQRRLMSASVQQILLGCMEEARRDVPVPLANVREAREALVVTLAEMVCTAYAAHIGAGHWKETYNTAKLIVETRDPASPPWRFGVAYFAIWYTAVVCEEAVNEAAAHEFMRLVDAAELGV